ncbi:MAG: SPOR domain-containing protein [Burkholderiaceae bacterium]|uniref:SPOR domain-containing protein n=1 Tax=Herminiimonas contaminans TaxID=1111140 RepID=A0ABS0EUN9_9BURK|nr:MULTISPECIES: SPOR domain-containing protein [Oxalobacteraceae]MBF8178555.1 SPOR domain-containing protein [Herminiimonas contaminans]MBX9798209.1 SPOR domain-containing protein [Burkholderiaceae bacterium]
MLKILFGLLLVINGGLYAFEHGYLNSLIPPSHDPLRLKQQLNPDLLKLVPLDKEKAEAGKAEKVAAVEPEKIPQTVEKPAEKPVEKPVEVLACTEIGNFDAAEAKNFEAKLTSLALGERLSRRQIQENARFIVYIPPLANKETADKKGGELKRLGVDDFFVITEHTALQWGISLGIFKSEEAARNHLAALNQKGVRSAKVGPHHLSAPKVAFQFRRIDAATKANLDKIRTTFPRQEARACT